MRLLLLLFLSSSLLASEGFASEGLIYRHVMTEASQSIHLLEVDPEKYAILPAKALDMGIGRESVASIATRNRAEAAVNGGFFATDGTFDGIPAGILKIDGNWYGLGKKVRGAIGWKREDCHPLFDRLETTAEVEINGFAITLDAINQPPKEHEATLFSSDFGFTTLTNPGVIEIVIDHGRVKSLSKLGSSYIPREGYVLSISPEKWLQIPEKSGNKYLKATLRFQVTPQIGQENWNDLDHIVGGAPLLIHNGQRITDFSSEMTTETLFMMRHARTAVGLLPNSHLLFVVVGDKGMTIDELAIYMESQGCIEALNLDGGSSTTMFYNNDIVNNLLGDELRKVSDAILITIH